MKFGRNKGKSIKDQFVLSVGDEGAIFCYFADGKLNNKFYIDSPASPDIKLIEKLLDTYKSTPVYLLVDVIEQNYSQQVLPPVSSFGIRQQVSRRIKRDFQPNDFTNVFFLNRSKEGRKDWNFLFISLANSDPFAKWLEIVLNHENPFMGVYLLPLESTKLIEDIDNKILEAPSGEWELLVLHNKVGGFRIVAFKNGKLIFTRLAQNLIGDNIPEIIVGNMEQEISNTVEYLRRLTFKGEADSKITIIAGAEVLQKVDVKALKFGNAHLFTPYDVAQKLHLEQSVTDKDKFADILMVAHFASSKKHVLRFNSPVTKKLETLYRAIKGVYIGFALLFLVTLGFTGDALTTYLDNRKEKQSIEANLESMKNKVKILTDQKNEISKDQPIDKLLDIMSVSDMMQSDKYSAIRVIDKITPQFTEFRIVDKLKMTVEKSEQNKKSVSHFELTIGMRFIIDSVDKDSLATTAEQFKTDLGKLVPKYKVSYSSEPKVEQSQFEKVSANQTPGHRDMITIPAEIKITGDL